MNPIDLSDIARLCPVRIVPVVVLDDVNKAAQLRDALRAGGIDCAEVTLRTAAAMDCIRVMAEDPAFAVGAGTVTTHAQVQLAFASGARFVVSPGLNRCVVTHCLGMSLPVFPGVMTPTEVMKALDLGLTELKFFPAATAGGPLAIKALSAPFPSVRFIPSGGISIDNAADFLALPQVAAVGGSWLTPPTLLKEGNFSEITRLTMAAVALATKAVAA